VWVEAGLRVEAPACSKSEDLQRKLSMLRGETNWRVRNAVFREGLAAVTAVFSRRARAWVATKSIESF
jgi:hypothetical protein